MNLKIGEKIRTLRLQQKMTQEQLADRLGVSYQSISRWENGIGDIWSWFRGGNTFEQDFWPKSLQYSSQQKYSYTRKTRYADTEIPFHIYLVCHLHQHRNSQQYRITHPHTTARYVFCFGINKPCISVTSNSPNPSIKRFNFIFLHSIKNMTNDLSREVLCIITIG